MTGFCKESVKDATTDLELIMNSMTRLRNLNRWGIVLAGGEGTRLRSFTRSITGDDRPKQFCGVLGGDTLLNLTRQRIASRISESQTLLVLTQTHEPFYRSLMEHTPEELCVIQPQNLGTTPAILYSLLRLTILAPQASVAFFPSDHHFSDDQAFMNSVEDGFRAVQAFPDRVILLGMEPESPEAEYGWIEPADPFHLRPGGPVFGVRRFWEKPDKDLVHTLFETGCLWNSFVMIGRVAVFLHLIRRSLPELFQEFSSIVLKMGTREETDSIRNLYKNLPSSNFSNDVLSGSADRLMVLPVEGVQWSDLGDPARVQRTLHRCGMQPAWKTDAVARPV